MTRAVTVALALLASTAMAGDWPMWRGDAARSARTQQAMPDELNMQWVSHLPPLRPAYRQKRLQFDACYEPVISGDRILVASSHDDSVAAGGIRLTTFLLLLKILRRPPEVFSSSSSLKFNFMSVTPWAIL